MLPSIEPVVLTGKVLPLGPDHRPSAIAKTVAPGPWQIARVGIVGDQQADLKNHGGEQKALHQYPFAHHAAWREDIGAHPLLGHPGSFGENLSTQDWTEQNVHVGDVVRFGAALLQVSQGRAPCWKLNARFGVTDMAYRVQSSGRTGWYYRVLEQGIVQPGSSLMLVDRLQPDWPLARIIRVMYRDKHNFGDLRLMSEIPELAEGWRQIARRRVEGRVVEDWSLRLGLKS